MKSKKIGLYVHIPFCKSKCPYCDFYSIPFSEDKADVYTDAAISAIEKSAAYTADTLYFGGGTPGILGTERIKKILFSAQKNMLTPDAEVTLELNPESAHKLDFSALRSAGVNRLSIGLQSSDDNELRLLGRLHDSKLAQETVKRAQSCGFDNISLDLMLGISSQTAESLKRSVEFCAELGVQHISAYVLKIEHGTPYYINKGKLSFPNDDEQAELYLKAVEYLENCGYSQYEISNFCVNGRESRHNLKYWNDEEYLGIGPSAHSFLNGKRFYCGRSFEDFYKGKIINDGEGGNQEEYAMLRLRLKKGLTNDEYRQRFGRDIPQEYFERCRSLKGLAVCDEGSIHLTTEGFLLSNSVIARIIF